jgi:serine/threonine-protein kinase
MTQQLAPDPVFLAFQAAVAGRYSIEREIGRGGMGIVYLAHEVHLDRLVAIKVLPPERAREPERRERFLREARLAAKLSHPNIIPIHAVDETNDFVYYVMALVDGETLGDRVRSRGPLSASEGARVLREVAWALSHAHAQGLVHRDVKPENILLESGSGRALVADFGIASVAGDSGVQGAIGTPEFMSPEQAGGGPIDARSDLYSLGATAFYAFSGRLPFEGRTATEIVAKHITERPPALASSGVTVPRRIAALIDRCLEKDPAKRPASADAVADQLGVAIEQRRELPAALRAFVKRNARMNGGGTLISTALLAGAAVTMAPVYGGAVAWGTLLAGATLGPLAFMVSAARGLLKQGFSAADVAPAFQREKEQASEELSVQRRQDVNRLDRLLKITAATSMSVFGAGIATLIGTVMAASAFGWGGPFGGPLDTLFESVLRLTLFSGMLGLPTSVMYLARLQQRTDIDTDFWSTVWSGPAGRLAFSIAKRSGVARPAAAAMTHRATELSLGLAAEQLYESLPKATRSALAELPAVLRRIQDDAQHLRARHEALQEALVGSTADNPEFDDLRQLRDDTQARLAETVGALETLRLGLLRLHAGAATVENFTTHIEIASDVATQVERLISAHSDVERVLRYSGEPAPTPA